MEEVTKLEAELSVTRTDLTVSLSGKQTDQGRTKELTRRVELLSSEKTVMQQELQLLELRYVAKKVELVNTLDTMHEIEARNNRLSDELRATAQCALCAQSPASSASRAVTARRARSRVARRARRNEERGERRRDMARAHAREAAASSRNGRAGTHSSAIEKATSVGVPWTWPSLAASSLSLRSDEK